VSLPAPTLICLTPVRDEAWILERFLACASLWADHIVIADQRSEDGSREIARRHPKVTLVDNPESRYDDGARRRLLIDAARAIPGRRILLALDADECLTSNVRDSQEWRTALSAPSGTVIRLPWINLLPGARAAWVPSEPIVVGFVDDGRPYSGPPIACSRVPTPSDAPSLELSEAGVLHYQYLDEERMRAKQRWYQCVERLEFPDKRPAEVYRLYHHMDAWPADQIHPVSPESLEAFRGLGIADLEVGRGGQDVWHRRILELMREHGTDPFRKLDIWDVDWAAEAARLGVQSFRESLSDPRSLVDRAALRWLGFAQPRRASASVRAVSRSLQAVGW
jgi:hypothetical protein